jgi:hypothetical protein
MDIPFHPPVAINGRFTGIRDYSTTDCTGDLKLSNLTVNTAFLYFQFCFGKNSSTLLSIWLIDKTTDSDILMMVI